MKKILIDGRFIGIGDSMSRYTLELVKGYLSLGSDFELTLLVRPQGKEIAEQFLSDQLSVTGNRELPENRKLKTDNLTIKVLDIPHYSLSEQTTLLKYLNKEKFDLVHFIQFNHPIRYRGRFVVTIHDLTLFGHLYRKGKIKSLAFNQVMKSAVKNSAKIITISKTSKQAIVDNYQVEPSKIIVTYLGVDEKYNTRVRSQKSKVQSVKAKYKIVDDYILYTGMWKRHKNIVRMLRAFEQYSSTDPENSSKNTRGVGSDSPGVGGLRNIQLVLAGKIDKNEPEVTAEINRINSPFCHPAPPPCHPEQKLCHCEESSTWQSPAHPDPSLCHPEPPNCHPELDSGSIIPDNRKWVTNNPAILAVGFVDEADLPYLYAGALAYCIPSLSEGFGLPPLEAMATGTPVISSNVSAMPEILGDAALYFDPYGVRDIEKAIERITTDEKLRSDLSKKGIEQSKRYSWQITAKETLDVYREVLK